MDGVLTVNAGSSSVKYALFASDAALAAPLLTGQVQGLGSGPAGPTHAAAFDEVLARVAAAGAHVAGGAFHLPG